MCLICLFGEQSTNVTTIIDNVQKTLTSLGIVAGGAWAYFHYFKGRIYRPRLEPFISGNLVPEPDRNVLIVTASLKNTGLSRLPIQQEGSAVRLHARQANRSESKAGLSKWDHLASFPVFEEHSWIEPNEKIEDTMSIDIQKSENNMFLMELRVVSKNISWTISNVIAQNKEKEWANDSPPA